MRIMKLAGLAAMMLLILAIPTGVGILIMHQPGPIPSTAIPLPADNDGAYHGSRTIPAEVFDSVLSQPTLSLDQLPTERITFLSKDGQSTVPNGGSVTLTDNLRVRIAVDPYPPGSQSVSLDLYLTTEDGSPITDAGMDMTYNMYMMEHDIDQISVQANEEGHYVAPLKFSMFGSWQLNIFITLNGTDKPIPLSIVLNVWPE